MALYCPLYFYYTLFYSTFVPFPWLRLHNNLRLRLAAGFRPQRPSVSSKLCLLAMFTLTKHPPGGTLSVRPVNKATDRSVVREIFRREFYGNDKTQYPDDGLWEIYDRMDTNGAFGAYLVSQYNHILFLLEVHPAVQMDLRGEFLSQPGTIGIYCFYHSLQETVNLPAIQACINSLFNDPSIGNILTTLNYIAPGDPRSLLLERAGFTRLTGNTDRSAVYCCTRDSFRRAGLTVVPHNEQSSVHA